MADESIRQDFYDGVHEVFETLFNDGINDGVDFHSLHEANINDVYGEAKVKKYNPFKRLIARVVINPEHGDSSVETITRKASFFVTTKSLDQNEMPMTPKDIEYYLKGRMHHHDVWYQIDNIKPKIYVEDLFHAWEFVCSELKTFDRNVVMQHPEIIEEDAELSADDVLIGE